MATDWDALLGSLGGFSIPKDPMTAEQAARVRLVLHDEAGRIQAGTTVLDALERVLRAATEAAGKVS